MNRLNLLFFALLISFIHNTFSEFNTIFLQSFLFLFFSELISIKLFTYTTKYENSKKSKRRIENLNKNDIQTVAWWWKGSVDNRSGREDFHVSRRQIAFAFGYGLLRICGSFDFGHFDGRYWEKEILVAG